MFGRLNAAIVKAIAIDMFFMVFSPICLIGKQHCIILCYLPIKNLSGRLKPHITHMGDYFLEF